MKTDSYSINYEEHNWKFALDYIDKSIKLNFSRSPEIIETLDIKNNIIKVAKKKVRNQKKEDWKRDFLEISAWTHLDDSSKVKLDKWSIETF